MSYKRGLALFSLVLGLTLLVTLLLAKELSAQSDKSAEEKTKIFLPVLSNPQSAVKQANQLDWDAWDVIPGRLLVEFRPEFTQRLLLGEISAANVPGLSLTSIEEPIRQMVQSAAVSEPFISILPNTFIGEFEPADRERILTTLAANLDVVAVEPDRIRVTSLTWGTATPNDYSSTEQWGMKRIHAPESWSRQPTTRTAIRVAVMELDRYDDSHRDLSGQHVAINHTGVISDHPTHVAGILAATGNNNTDVVGVANVELVSLSTGGNDSGFAQQISWAVNNSIRVINMSFKWCGNDGIDNGDDCSKCLNPAPNAQVQEAINNALNTTVLVAAAGNYSCNTDSSGRRQVPASYDGVIAVSALTQRDTRASFSNFGDYVDLTAPGVNISSTVTANRTALESGTSMAAPHVAGTAAAVLAIEPTYDIRSIPRLLELTAEDIGTGGRDDDFGFGVVRADRAVAAIADVYVQAESICFFRSGTLNSPFCSFARAIDQVPDHGTIGLVTGNFLNAPVTISKPLTLVSVGGVVEVK